MGNIHDRIIYDRRLLDRLIKKYAEAADIFSRLADGLTQAQNCVAAYYTGQANELADASLSAAAGHLNLISQYLQNTGEFVRYSKQEMIRADSHQPGHGRMDHGHR